MKTGKIKTEDKSKLIKQEVGIVSSLNLKHREYRTAEIAGFKYLISGKNVLYFIIFE